MIDIHSHILPRVDDGSEDIEMSLEMARMYVESGINTVIATPHYIEDSIVTSIYNNRTTLEELKKELDNAGLKLEILLGNEVFISMNLIKDIEEERVSTLNETRYILIELPMFDIPLYVENVIYELLLKGYIPIIAHPERNTKIIEDPNILYEYIIKGALAQLNLPSLEGKYGSKTKKTAEIFLKNHMIHFIGTDAHTNRGRSPKSENSLKILGEIISPEDFERLTFRNAELLLENKIIETKSPVKYKKRRDIFKFLNKTSRRL